MIIFDLDGTLADCEHRRHFVDATKSMEHPPYYIVKEDLSTEIGGYENPITGKKFKPDWKAFFEACDKDRLILPMAEVLRALWRNEPLKIIQIWTGRCESVREKTEKWLLDNGILKGRVKMRPVGDSTPDDVLKEQWLDELNRCGMHVDYVFDDRPKVVRMWRRRGIFVFDVNQSGKEF